MKSQHYLLKLQKETNRDDLAAAWQQHKFYKTALVLGIDIGLEGIGIYLRKGREEVFAKTVDVNNVLPGANALENRRQMRHGRRNRANKRTRLSRLDALLMKHGLPLPWKDNKPAYENSDPFKLRHRAAREEGNGLNSKEALSIAIRSCVALRGYDYGRFSEEGEHPWGTSPKLNKALEWLKTASIDETIERRLREYAVERTLAAPKDKAESMWAEFEEEIGKRLEASQQHTIESVLREHFKGDKHDNLRARARGFAFPRQKVWEHLERIVRRHAALIGDAEAFLDALGLDPDDKKRFPDVRSAAAAREKAIFSYNRKSILEMEAHWAKKRKDCPYASRLELGEQKTSKRGHRALRQWAALEFGITRRVEITFTDAERIKQLKTAGQKVNKTKCHKEFLHTLTPGAVKALVDLIGAQYAGDPEMPLLDKERRSAARAAAREIVEEDIRQHCGVSPDLQPKAAPMPKDSWNESFFDQLSDIAAPNDLAGTGSLFAGTAERLFDTATGGGADFSAAGFNQRLTELGFYDWRRESVLDWGVYPQVEFLLGRRVKHGKRKGEVSSSCRGFLRQLFESFQQDGHPLKGITLPDYVTVEVVGDAPRTTKEKKDILAEQKKNRDARKEAWEKSTAKDSGVASRHRRLALHRQQNKRCPYTGDALPDDALDPRLEIEHIFPAEMGGLSVDDNLVLTFRETNKKKGKKTPMQWLGEERVKELAKANADMRWSALKREVFIWGTRREDDPAGKWPKHYDDDGSLLIPNFGNMTRTAQLARQLKAAVEDWLGIAKEPEEIARRIATPSGWLASQALKSWMPDYRKDRGDLTHHLIDAAVLAHIPPREGMNSVHCGGIFFTEREVEDNAQKPGEKTDRLVTRALPGLLDAGCLSKWLPERREYAECPVMLRKSRSNKGSLGDSTFWRHADSGKADLAQREGDPFNPADFDGDAKKLQAALIKMGINERKHRQWCARNMRKGLPPPPFKDVLPTIGDIEKYLEASTAMVQAERGKTPPVLRLRDGKDGKPWTPITKLWKWNSKGPLGKGLGWSGRRNEKGVFTELRSLAEKYDRLEIWLGYDWDAARRARKAKAADWEAKGWTYYRRLIPNATALRHLKQLGLRFDRDARNPAPAFMQEKPDEPGTHQTLRQMLLGDKLPAFARKVGQFQKDDVLLIGLNREGAIAGKDEEVFWSAHFKVTSIGGSFALEMKPLLFADKSVTPLKDMERKHLVQKAKDSDVHAALLSLPTASQLALQMMAANSKIRIPPEPPAKEKEKANDPPSDPPRRSGGRDTATGQGALFRQEDRD